jgi:hypothetical protein
MIESSIQLAFVPFARARANSADQALLDNYEATANRNDRSASWHVNGQNNLQKIAVDALGSPVAFDSAIAKLKTQYEFFEGQDEDILAVLSHYPFLMVDLDRIHEIKCQYFDEAPMSLYYINETGYLENASLSASVEFDDDLWDKKFESSFYKFRDKCWQEVSKESHGFITVGFE